MYLNTIQIIGFIGKDPERRRLQGGDAEYTVFSVATQRSWKDAKGEWQKRTDWHRVVAWSRLGKLAIAGLHRGDHVHVQGRLVSSTYDKQVGNGKKPTVVKQTYWQVRAESIRKLSRAEAQPGPASGATGADEANAAAAAPF
jgi:single-strand DNA-binding protein